ncbi:MAG: tRNA preQ1(34) S-adenosylmethionine ribosyltransferase-isomerase QueA [Oscillospiraceae bacterium]|jgi:S-adenosylmethionine:tRNA ribosyltransferase-isomerase|nr:tRNA preQ1(34) S-adenosylmethionine ribosyltransferase-isomerase QueA [Oscillospiraceae bacterium]
MRTDDFNYDLPPGCIAQTPAEPRDSSRLMVCHRDTGIIEHRRFRNLPDYLSPGDVLVVNDSRVLPARLLGHKSDTGGAVELLLLKRLSLTRWEALVRPGARLREGARAEFGGGLLRAVIQDRTPGNARMVEFGWDDASGTFEQLLDKLGEMPLPPYIREKLADPERYQTVYAVRAGSAAAPTAGLHFTSELLRHIQDKGVSVARVLLHVGLSTFRPVHSGEVESHEMHSEYYEVTQDAARLINDAREAGRRVVCVGTTSVRVVESAAKDGRIAPSSGWTSIYIYPGYSYQVADVIVTNFHLPKSTLLMLVSAFWSREAVLDAYSVAVREGYRFYSFGDSMVMI